jgi:pyruvate ferredoxin oxidoreductase alpha subunit
MVKKMLRGSQAIAEAVALCRPGVICAYPITPQTIIVEDLATMVADGELRAEYINCEGEHSAASIVLGATATGVRSFTASSSQGLILMSEVLFNAAGMRMPIVLVCANRSLSAPLSIWNDQQDSISVRDSGVIQLYAENNQEAVDLIPLAYRIAEDHRVMLPVMVCVDGFYLPHAYEAVEIPSQEEVDAFLPPYQPIYKLDPHNPLTFGMYCEPDKYMETRYMVHRAMDKAIQVIQEAAHRFERVFARPCCGLMEEYHIEDATTVFVAMGSIVATIKEVVDELRGVGERVGVLKLVCYRPFPKEQIYEALKKADKVIVLERAISLGSYGSLASEIRSTFYNRPYQPSISGFIAGLGGRDVTPNTIKQSLEVARKETVDTHFLDLRTDLELEGVE